MRFIAIGKLFLLLVLVLSWLAFLWVGLRIELSRWGNAALIAIHILPPLCAWGGWIAWRAWRNRRQAAEQAAEAEAKRAELERRRAEIRAAFEKELAERRASVECRWLQARDLIAHGDADALATSGEGIAVLLSEAGLASMTVEAGATWPAHALVESFVDLIATCPAAAALPVYVHGPGDISFSDLAETVRAAREEAMRQVGVEMPQGISAGAVLGLPQSVASPEELVDLFASQPELPGAVVLAFESPLATRAASEADSDVASEAVLGREQHLGKPGRALVVMLLTAPGVSEALAQLAQVGSNGAAEAMTPYWDRTQPAQGMTAWLAPLPAEWREALAATPVIACLRRPAWLETEDRERPLQLAQHLRRLLESAGINAGLIEPRFEFEWEAGEPPVPPLKIGDSGWIVHNAGGVAVSGNRLAGIGRALAETGVDLCPVNDATNVVVHAGDCGRAMPYLMLALAMAKAAGLGKPALVTNFTERRVAMSFVLPVTA